ncbi:hypothetical protein [Arcicella rosea]|uniref:Outer membrane protein beta-barrel domain-containing protein n=1 Tax=Arcicella rosea TaxID=502909 RepID=A0A841EJL6_9BACT|nr:hypothetical protein [Arcicella rosea]MBB6002404.1 hypothetical protein [Arcicella rosea]
MQSKRYLTFILFITAFYLCPNSNVCAIADSTNVHKHNGSIGVSLGTNGLGLEFAKATRFKKIYWRVGTTYLQYHRLFNVNLNTKSTINIESDLKFNQIFLASQIYPFQKSSFHLIGGASYLYNFNVSAFIDTNTGISYEGVEVNAEDFGEISIKVDWNKIVPFVGFGFGKIIPRKRLSFNGEIGCYYMGSPVIKSEYFGILDTTNADELIPIIERNIKDYSFLPFINLKIRYSIGD